MIIDNYYNFHTMLLSNFLMITTNTLNLKYNIFHTRSSHQQYKFDIFSNALPSTKHFNI